MRKAPTPAGDRWIGETALALNPDAKAPIPSRTKSRLERVGGWLICTGATIACGVALFNFGTWWWWQDWRIGAAAHTVPMAPSTASLLLLLGGALLLRQHWGEKAAVRLIGFVASGIAAVPAVIAGLRQVTGVELAWESLLVRTDDTVRGIPVGQISPLSAGAFVLAAISLAAVLPPLAERRLFHRVGLVTASLGAVASLIITLAYASGTPLFYGGGIIPMAFLTATAFAALFLALLTAAVSGARRRAGDAGAPLLYPAPSWLGTERHLLIVFGVLALGIGLTGIFALRVRQTAMRERIANELETIADLKVGQIVNWRNERLADVRLLMQTHSWARSAAAFFAHPDSVTTAAELFADLNALRNIYRYDAVVLFDDRMNPRLVVPAVAETSGLRLRALLEAVPASGDVLVSDLHRGVSGGIHMDFVAPLRDLVAGPADQNSAPTPSAIGALLLRIDARDFLYPLIQKWPVPNETAETLLVRREGDEVVYLNDLRHQRGTALTLSRSINDQQIPAVMGAGGMFGVTEGVDYRGVEVLAAVRAVPGSPWILVAKEDQSEIYAPLRRQALAMGATVMSLLLGAAFGVAYLSRQTCANFLCRELAAETERRSLAERLALITQHANDIVLLSDESGRIIEANDRAFTTYGYSLDELRQLPPGGLRPFAAMDGLPRHFALFDSEEGTVFETVHQRKDGTVFPVEVSGRSVEFEGRKVRLGIFRDITGRKQADEARRRAEEQYRSIFENALEGIYQTTPQGTFLTANPAMARILGYASADALVRERTDIARQGYVDPHCREEFARRIEADDIVSGFEYEAYRKDGSKVWVSENARVVRDGHGRVACYEGSLDDITERKQAEAALRQSEERYRQLFEHNPLPMWLYDLETLGFLAVNESAVRAYGYSRAEFLDMTIKRIRPEEDIPALLQSVADVQTVGGRSSSEYRHRRKDGTIFHVEVISGPLMFEGRKARLVLAADITEKKLLEEKSLHAQRLDSIGMLAAGIAHDLNNVLAPIMFAAPLLRGSLTEPRDLKILDTLEMSAGRGAGLVRHILGFARSTTGEFQPTQVKHLARDIISVIEETFPKSIQIEHHIPSDLWPVQGSATQIHQVLMNLCVNARDAMPEGGTLRVAASNRLLDVTEAGTIPGAGSGAWLVLEVSDTGTGIPTEVLKHIWEPFFTTKGVGKGTGLGLSTVRGIVASHRGFVELQSEVGRGTTFRVFLPAMANEESRQITTSPIPIPDGNGELILLVDDDAAICGFVSAILRERGYRVVSCADGVEAITHFTTRRSEISLVITDVDMPRLGGVALARALLQLCPDIQLLAMSGLSRGETDVSGVPGIKQLAHAFLLKPFTADDLLGVVHRLLHPAGKP